MNFSLFMKMTVSPYGSSEQRCYSEDVVKNRRTSESENEGQDVEGDVHLPKMHQVRIIKVPKLNFKANSYTEMIDWTTDVHEPPLVKHLTNDQLQQCM
jgi:hypothetical protein